MTQGLTFPYLTDADPEIGGEGTLDPLGLESIANSLADEIAPGITARMSRIRFVTAVAVASVVNSPLEDTIPADGKSTPQLAFEWLVVESIARCRDLPAEATRAVPGIDKARAAALRGGHLDARSYLKTPKVFGFHGVYKRLARHIEVIDEDFELQERGDRLVRAWEHQHALQGFADRAPNTPGGELCVRLETAVRTTLTSGGVRESPKASLWRRLSDLFRPDGGGPAERGLLKDWLLDPSAPLRREVVTALAALPRLQDESEALREVRKGASPELKARLDAIRAYEHFSELLICSLETLQYLSTVHSSSPVSAAEFGGHPMTGTCLRKLGDGYRKAIELLEPLNLSVEFEQEFGDFADVRTADDLFELILTHHEQVQREKPPGGKRAWFDRLQKGVAVRFPFRRDEPPLLTETYLHPFRVRAIQSFAEDLR
jgi:hypothetical protein